MLALLLLTSIPSSTHASPLGASTLAVSTVSQGVQLTLSVPARTYPRHALVRVTLRAHNVSHRMVQLDLRSAAVIVLDASGRVVYPPPSPTWMPPPTGGPLIPSLPRLLPGKSSTVRTYTVLNGNRLQVTAPIGSNGSQLITPLLEVPTRASVVPHLRILSFRSPRVQFSGGGSARGNLLYAASFECADKTGGNSYVDGVGVWMHAYGRVIGLTTSKQCTRMRALVIMAGYPNHPVAVLRYPTSRT
jgi:hypothetical protein